MKRLHLVELYADGTGLAHSAGCEEDGLNDSFIQEAMSKQPDGSPGYWIWASVEYDAARLGNMKLKWSDLE